MEFTVIKAWTEDAIGLVQLNRPEVLNALSQELFEEVLTALEAFDADPAIRCMILTGSGRAFSAGADIKQMARMSAADQMASPAPARWERLRRLRKPIVAAVNGFALGGGCELMMCCDIVVAAETARFGQPEINIGIIPGAGGTQRLTRVVGKCKAMELILTGRQMSATEAEALGLVNRVVAPELVLEEARRMAREIAAKSPIAVRTAKECVQKALETPLSVGLEFERKMFALLFATEDKVEGMQAFIEKREPKFKGS
jgi:enoyl-CoA hydratase